MYLILLIYLSTVLYHLYKNKDDNIQKSYGSELNYKF